MNRFTLRHSTIAIAAICLVSSAASAATRQETIEETMSFAAGGLLEVANTNGRIEVTAWDGDGIHIVAEKTVKSRGADVDEAFEALEVVIEQTPDGVRIDTVYPRRNGGWWRDISMNVSYHIQVPRSADLKLDTVNGKVVVEGVRGDLTLGTTNGGITVEDSGGRVDAHTTNGGIDVELREFAANEDMSFRSTNGGISVSLPSDLRATVEARTVNGGINIDFPVTVQGEISKKRLRGEINGGGGLINLRTTNGGIRIREL